MTDCQTHRVKDPFVRFLKSIVMDSRISWKAKGILTYAFCRTGDWKFYKSEIMKHATDGRESFTSGIKELEKYGYLWKEATQNPGTGQFESCIWHFYEDPSDNPQFQNKSTEERVSRLSDNLNDGEPVPILKKDCLPKKDNNADVVSFSDQTNNLLDQLPFDPMFKSYIHKMKNEDGYVTEKQVQFAANVALKSKWDNIQGFFTDVLKNPDKYSMPAEPGEKDRQDKEWTIQELKKFNTPPGITIEPLAKYLEIGNGTHQPSCITYGEASYQQKFHEALKKWGIVFN